jgi:hypothetical protein
MRAGGGGGEMKLFAVERWHLQRKRIFLEEILAISSCRFHPNCHQNVPFPRIILAFGERQKSFSTTTESQLTTRHCELRRNIVVGVFH